MLDLCAENSKQQKSIKKNKNIFGPVAEQKQLCRPKQPKTTTSALGDVSLMFYIEVLTDTKLSSFAFSYVMAL